MARLPAPGSVIVPDWHESAEGKEYLACILRKNRRWVFGKCPPPPACHLPLPGENSVPCGGGRGAEKQGSEGLLHCTPQPWGPQKPYPGVPTPKPP